MPLSFDPFAIGPHHQEHSNSTSIIKLEESGRIFCPKCLDQVTFENIDKVDDVLFNQYVMNLFETLDQYDGSKQLRKIALTTLEILLKRRASNISSDHEFHNMLRVIHKTISNDEFDPNEFPPIVGIFSVITGFIDTNPMPLMSIGKALEKMLDYVREHLYQYKIDIINGTTFESANFLRSASTIIKIYLNIIKRFSVDRASDLIFPLYEGESPLMHQKKYRQDMQTICLKFMSDNLIPHCWTCLSKINRPLEQHEQDMVGEFFEAMGESFLAASRINYNKYLQLLIENDCILVAHTTIYKNPGTELRGRIRNFLNYYVLYYLELEFGTDDAFIEFKQTVDIVETNHKNAIAFSYDKTKFRRTLFYILTNFLAYKQKSKYYFRKRVEKVIKILIPSSIHLDKSRIFRKVYNFLVASLGETLRLSENVDRYFTQRLLKLREEENFLEFDDEFCFDESVFFWARKHPEFFEMVTVKTIGCLVKMGMKIDKTTEILWTLLKNRHYKELIIHYFREEDSAIDAVEAIVKFDQIRSNQQSRHKIHDLLITELSAILSAALHSMVLETINDTGKDAPTDEHTICALINVILILLKRCEHFQFELDEQFLKDMFGLMAHLYEIKGDKYKEETIMMTKLVTQLMISNSPYLMSILKHLNYFVLGQMYYRIANYDCEDDLADSIARLLVTYDKIDYPLLHDVRANLYVMDTTIIKWMLSKSSDLHNLSLKLVERVLLNQRQQQIRVSIATGLILMVIANFELFHNPDFLKTFIPLLDIDELRYNPLLSRLPDFVSNTVKEAVERKLRIFDDKPPTPSLSFSSVTSSPRSNSSFLGEGNTIFDILNQLNDDDNTDKSDDSHRIPESLYVSEAVKDQHCNSFDPDEWERTAQETTKDVDD